MTQPTKTVTDHLHDALSALDSDMPPPSALERAREAIDAALQAINLLRCEAQTAMDKL